jgi:cytosine/adenosine deaminase-related metal-dependent hydrolase
MTKTLGHSIMSEECDLLIRNAHILTMDGNRAVYPEGAIAIAGRDLVAVGSDMDIGSAYRAKRSIDAKGATVHPGLVDGHYHLDLHLTRGVVTDDPAQPAVGRRDKMEGTTLYGRWLNAMDDEAEHASALAPCTEMACCGVTCFMEAGNVFQPEAAAEAIERVGIRALLADSLLWDLDAMPLARETLRAPASIDRCLKVLGGQLKRNADPYALVRGHVAIYGSGSASDELQLTASRCARDNGVVFNQHLGFGPGEIDGEIARLGRHPARHLTDIGALGPHAACVHCNVLDDDAMNALVESGAMIVWHPANYMFYGVSQAAPYRMAALSERNVYMGFGTDVAKTWSFGDGPFIAYLLARDNGDYMAPHRLLEMMTIEGARIVGLSDRLGSLEAGKRADLVIRSANMPPGDPGVDRVLDAVLVSRTRSVTTVICDGQVIVEEGRATKVDMEAVRSLARTTVHRLVERSGIR